MIMNIKLFAAWCLEHGIESPLEIKTRPGDRYTILKDSKSSNDEEQRLVLCPLSASIVEPTKEELADRLQFERQQGSKSKFAPYVDILPQSLPDLPRFWEDAASLEQVPDGGVFRNELQTNKSSNHDDNSWAMACVDSRANVLPNGSYALTPLLDMINHDGSVETRASLENDSLSLFAHVNPSTPSWRFPFGAAPEVKISYGPLTNLQTLVDYGFVETDNPHNRESIWVNVIRKAPVRVMIAPDGSVDRSSICDVLSSLSLASEELDYIIGKTDTLQSQRNKIEVYALILGYLEEALYDITDAESSAMPLINFYIQERGKSLRTALNKITEDFPELAV